MLIALDYNLVDIQKRLGHRKPDTTLRIYAHQWAFREAQKNQIGNDLARLFNNQPPAAPDASSLTDAFPAAPDQTPLASSTDSH
jgi:hypothetical protein